MTITKMGDTGDVALRNDETVHIKMVVLGDCLVGKTSLLLAFTKRTFSDNEALTVNDSEYVKEMEIDGNKVKLALLEAPCLEGYEKVRKQMYPKTHCFIVCYALNNPSSSANVESHWLSEIRETNPDTPIVVTGTKLDLRYTATNPVPPEWAKKLKNKFHLQAVRECSAKSPESVENVFAEAFNAIRKRKEEKRSSCKPS